jgi:hydroxymethylpyrimidine pyrophosphatase-like HAD family hydrolase
MKVIYATDMDRTVIFSSAFLREVGRTVEGEGKNLEVVELKGDKVVSYISKEVKRQLTELSRRPEVEFVPVTTRSLEQFQRINIGDAHKYAIIDCGGTILEDGVPIEEWEEYVRNQYVRPAMMGLILDLQDIKGIEEVKIVDQKFLFAKIGDSTINDGNYFDEASLYVKERYPDFEIVRQNKKVYAIPRAFSKAVALRWLQHRIGIYNTVVSGDALVDLPMLAIANYAVVPTHGDIIKMGAVTGGRVVDGDIYSPLKTIDIVRKLADNEPID